MTSPARPNITDLVAVGGITVHGVRCFGFDRDETPGHARPAAAYRLFSSPSYAPILIIKRDAQWRNVIRACSKRRVGTGGLS